MKSISYSINDKNYNINVIGSPEFSLGEDQVLSNSQTDITSNQHWYNLGYKAINILNDKEFADLLEGLTSCVKKIILDKLNIVVDTFNLSDYHKIVTNDEDHFKVISKTRDLFPDDFNFPIENMIGRFENILDFKLTDINPRDNKKLHIIVRINRPGSSDYNPPHKDIYEGVDEESYIPQIVNLWIPICGVTQKSSLPVAEASHLLPENKIMRTRDGGVVEGKKYSVRMIKSWDGSNKLERPNVKYGEALFFSSHLIHGLAINEENDTTRVSLEFRLFKK